MQRAPLPPTTAQSLEQRVDALEDEIQRIWLSMGTQRQAVAQASQPAGAPTGDGEERGGAGKGPAGESNGAEAPGNALLGDTDSEESLDEEAADEVLDELTYTMKQSAWDASLFIGYPLFDMREALMLAAGLVCNVGLQLYVVAILFRDPAFGWTDDDAVVAAAWKWRLHYGHSFSYLDRVTGTSLTTRVCNEDAGLHISSSKVGQVHYSLRYLSDGPVLSKLMLFLFALKICAELRDISYFTAGVLGVPRDSGTSIALVHGKPVLVKLSMGRATIGCVISVLRTSIAFSLLHCGSIWLASTVELESLIMNAVALTFVLDTDEIVYTAISPHRLDNLLEDLQPLPCMQGSYIRHNVYRPLSFLMAAVWVLFTMFGKVDRVKDTQDAVHDALCGGFQNFAFATDPAGALYWATSAPHAGDKDAQESFSNRDNVSEARMNIVDRIIEKDFDHLGDSTFTVLGELPSISEQTPRTMASSAECKDSDAFFSKAMHIATGNSSFQMDDGDMLGCADARQYCQMVPSFGVRVYCPETCGCSDPTSGGPYWLPDGCPTSCLQSVGYRSALRQLPCKDWSLHDLRQSDGWSSMYFGLKHLMMEVWAKQNERIDKLWSPKRLESLDCPGMMRFVVDENFFNIDLHDDVKRVASYAVEVTCSAIASFCPETCWCANASMQASWPIPSRAFLENLVENHCPTSCKV